MNYSLDEIDALAEAVEGQGGAALPEKCVPQDIKYTDPPYARNKTERRVTCGCKQETMFVSAYDPGPDTKENAGFVRACAVCDSMGAWPRYEHVLGD